MPDLLAEDLSLFPGLAESDFTPKASGTKTGAATMFADPRDQARYAAARRAGKSVSQALRVGDPGVGSPALGVISTANAYGVAAPTEYLREQFGHNPSSWRTARAKVTIGDRTITVPYVDVGPGKGAQKRGVVTDVTYPLSQALGGFDKTKAKIEAIPNAGPDYTSDKNAWFQEQSQIAAQLNVGAGQQIGGEPAPTPFNISVLPSMPGNAPDLSGAGPQLAQARSSSSTPVTSSTELAEIPSFQAGGIVTKPTVALVGEAGPEAIVPLGLQATAAENAPQSGQVETSDPLSFLFTNPALVDQQDTTPVTGSDNLVGQLKPNPRLEARTQAEMFRQEVANRQHQEMLGGGLSQAVLGEAGSRPARSYALQAPQPIELPTGSQGIYEPQPINLRSWYQEGAQGGGALSDLLNQHYRPDSTRVPLTRTPAATINQIATTPDTTPVTTPYEENPQTTKPPGEAANANLDLASGYDRVVGNGTTWGLDYDTGKDDAMDPNPETAFGFNSHDKNIEGASLPISVIKATIGDYLNNPKIMEAIKRGDYKIAVTNESGLTKTVPLIDAGPADWTGNAIDLTYKTAHDLNTGGKAKVGYQIIGPDGEVMQVKGYHPHTMRETNWDHHFKSGSQETEEKPAVPLRKKSTVATTTEKPESAPTETVEEKEPKENPKAYRTAGMKEWEKEEGITPIEE